MLKDYMKMTGVVAVLVSMMPLTSARAAEELTKAQRAEAQQIEGHIFLLAQRHLTEEESKTLADLISKGLERSYQSTLLKEKSK